MKKLWVILSLFIFGFSLSACTFLADERDKPIVIATLFPQYDIARTLADDLADVRLILPPGVDAHTFEPTPRMISDMLGADLILQTSDRMEPWVNRLLSHQSQSLPIVRLSDHVNRVYGDPHDYQEGDTIITFELLDVEMHNAMTAWFHVDHWHGSLPTIPLSETVEIGAFVANARGQAIPITNDAYRLEARLGDFMPSDIVSFERVNDTIVFEGLRNGLTQVIFELYFQDELIFETPPINVQVSDEVERVIPDAPAPEDDTQDGDYDPHIWTDPLNVILMTQIIEEELITLLPDHENEIRTRSEAYIQELEHLHEAFLHMREHIEVTTLLYGGHNAMGYFIARYNLTYINAYRGFSTDAEPIPTALAEMIQTMQLYQLEHLFSEKMLNQNVAQTIQRETGATILYLFAMENVTPQELSEGLSLIDMFEHNLEQLKIGLRYQN